MPTVVICQPSEVPDQVWLCLIINNGREFYQSRLISVDLRGKLKGI